MIGNLIWFVNEPCKKLKGQSRKFIFSRPPSGGWGIWIPIYIILADHLVVFGNFRNNIFPYGNIDRDGNNNNVSCIVYIKSSRHPKFKMRIFALSSDSIIQKR